MDYGFDWGFFFYTTIYGFVVWRVAIWFHNFHNEYREKQFLKHIRIQYPDSVVTLSTVETSDRKALEKLREELDSR